MLFLKTQQDHFNYKNCWKRDRKQLIQLKSKLNSTLKIGNTLVYIYNRGVIIDNIYIKDIKLSKDLQEALSSAATEARSA